MFGIKAHHLLISVAVAGLLLAGCKQSTNTPITPASLTNWTWQSGSGIANGLGNFGTKGVPSALNLPSPRSGAMSWVDATNQFWLFGGSSGVSDMWVFNSQNLSWLWNAGSNTLTSGVYGTITVPAANNLPGPRNSGATWTDGAGNFWLFGGYGIDVNGQTGYLNDVWMFNPTTLQWTWMGGSQQGGALATSATCNPSAPASATPPTPRSNSAFWKDAAGDFWIFGGQGFVGGIAGMQNDLWKYNSTTNRWSCINGTSALNTTGVYGTAGVPSAFNQPGSRESATTWTDASGNFWMFGGTGIDSVAGNGELADLWSFNPLSNLWTYVQGPKTINALGNYGSNDQSAATNQPGGRSGAIGWTDSSGNRWLFGGHGINANGTYVILNDLWEYQVSNGQWLWLNGSYNGNMAGRYGSLGVMSSSNMPGSRFSSTAWKDGSGNFWLFGGSGFDAAGTNGHLNDVWKFVPH